MQGKLFETTDMAVLQNLIGAKIKKIIFQPTNFVFGSDMLIFNFASKNQQFSLHVTCFARIIKGNELILTSSDEYFATDYKCLEEECNENFLTKNIQVAMTKLSNSIISKISLTETADIVLQMDNGIKIEITPDCIGQDYEYYRFFQINKGTHYVVYSHDGQIFFNLQ